MTTATEDRANGAVTISPPPQFVSIGKPGEVIEAGDASFATGRSAPDMEALWGYRRTTDKVAILGHSPSTRDDAPYDDPSYTIATLNDAHAFTTGRRVDVWFEIHTRNVYANPDRRTAGYLDHLRRFPGPVYMIDAEPSIPGLVRYPTASVEARYGRLTNRQGRLVTEPVLTSGFSYMLAWAIDLGYTRIEFYGADLMGEEEYIRQREGFAFLYGLGLGKGIEMVLPDACPILRAPLYGQNPTEASGLTEDFISNKIQKFRKQQSEHQTKAIYLSGKADAYVELRAEFGR